MANLIFEAEGSRGRHICLYDTKCVITTNVTIGSVITGNSTDGEKTIFLCDVIGVQFKKSGTLIGYLQFETASTQMNNKDSNMFSENTFTFEHGKNGLTNETMQNVYNYVVTRLEELKYGACPAESSVPAPKIVKETPAQTFSQSTTSASSDSTGDTWICKKCGSKNTKFQRSCKDCGAYK